MKTAFLSSYKIIILIFSTLFALVDGECTTRNYKSLIISIGTIINNPEMLRFVPDYFKTNKACKHKVKKLLLLIRYVSNWYKTQEMWGKIVLENGGTLKFVPDCYKNQTMRNKTDDNYAYVLEFDPNW